MTSKDLNAASRSMDRLDLAIADLRKIAVKSPPKSARPAIESIIKEMTTAQAQGEKMVLALKALMP